MTLLGTPRPAPAPPVLPEMREFGDAAATRQRIYKQVFDAARTMAPAKNQLHSLHLSDVEWADPEDRDYAQQKKALLSGQTLARRLRGTWQLRDNATDQILDEKRMTVARVPYLTDRGTFIHHGNEYALRHQLRLKPGIYTRVRHNGEIEAHVNVMPGQGRSHRYELDPAKGVFYLRMSQARLPLLPILRSLGVQDKELRDAWGPELLASNYQHDDPQAVRRLAAAILRPADAEGEPSALGPRLQAAFAKMGLDPNVMQHTLGHPHAAADLPAILATTKKLLGVSRGEQDTDDRDHLAYQQLLGPEDLLSERLTKDHGRTRATMLWKASLRRNLGQVHPGALDRQLEAALITSGLGENLEETNPGEILDKQTALTRMGEGGIPSLESAPKESRDVQPSHLGFIDPLRTPEKASAGLDVYLSSGARKGADGELYVPFRDPRTGQQVWKTPRQASDATITFPGVLALPGKRVYAFKGGRLRPVKKRDINLIFPHFERAFSPLGNLIPMKSAIKGQRAVMASRMTTQALPLTDPESPLVQSALPEDPAKSFEEHYGRHMGAMHAGAAGQVLDVTPQHVKIRNADGTTKTHALYEYFPLNRRTYMHHTPVVKPGDQVQPGQLLASSNYTDGKGVTALGKNLTVAMIPFRGQNIEDAIVISQSAANKKLTSEHAYQHAVDWEPTHKPGKRSYLGIFPSTFDRKTLDTLDDHGVVMPGTEVGYGQPLILAAQQRGSAQHKLHRRGEAGYVDRSVLWEHQAPGIVTDVVHSPRGVQVLVKSQAPMQVGDKLTGRYGDKGTISMIVPDEKMPQRDGEPIDVIVNPLGVISRGNPAQLVEAALGKIARKTGQPYKVHDFHDIQDITAYAQQELKKHGLSDLEDLIDPATGRKIPQVFVGNRFFMKLHHLSESKDQSRGAEGGYTQADEPAKGGDTSAKRLSLLDANALLSHGATAVLRDASVVRGQRNEDYWLAFMQGHTPPPPRVPLIYQKFLHELQASGINVVPRGHRLQVMAMTNQDVQHLAGDREIVNGETVHWKQGLKPVTGGLFDPALTGGHGGKKWSKITLPEPLPNPVFEEPIRRLLDLTGSEFQEVLAGRKPLRNGGTGPNGIKDALAAMNVPTAIAAARMAMNSGRKTARDVAVRKLGYLKSLQKLNLKPEDWLLNHVPVLPPAFRPVSTLSGGKLPLVSDPNYLYKELLTARDNFKQMQPQVTDLGEERLALYHSLQAVTGLADPVQPQLQEKHVQGLLKGIFGSSPKHSTVQRRLIGSTTDLVGRAVITPDAELDMDQVGLPEEKAWSVYRNFVVRRLHRRGMPITAALEQVRQRSGLAKEVLQEELDHRPVLINRAPVLHRFGIMAFRPQLIKGDTLRVSPLVLKGFNADFDGDQMNYHVPVDEEARKEALERLLPSRNLLSPTDFKTPVYQPINEFLGGLYHATAKASERRPRTFATLKDARAALARGEIAINDPVQILKP